FKAAAETAVNKFSIDPENNTIPQKYRRLMRHIVDFMPRSGTTNRTLALHVHMLDRDQFKCRFHIEKRSQKQAKQVDGPALGKFVIVGVPYNASALKKTIADGIMACGCEITSVLWDFFWWMTWTVASGNPKITDLEMMKSDVLDVRHRAFFIQAYKKATKLDLDDLYTGTDIQFGSDPYVQRVALTQANRLVGMAGQSG
ncbi:hypothetical protein B0H14DRAFT_2200313, partial [Mycena olivaceomarginata]